WRTDLDAAHELVQRAVVKLGEDRVMVAPSCSLLHVPVGLASETSLEAELLAWMAFATEKLGEVAALARADSTGAVYSAARRAIGSRAASWRVTNPAVRARAAAITDDMSRRAAPYS